jgi:hypothetical protein
MPAFSTKRIESLISALERVANYYFSKMPLILSPEEIISAFVNPDHIAKLREVEELVGFVGRTDFQFTMHIDGCSLPLRVGFNRRPPILLPQYVTGGLQPTCDEATLATIHGWAGERLRLGFAFGDVHDALNQLNYVCQDPNAMATLLPCLPYLMSMINDDEEAGTTKSARKLAQNKSVGRLPRLPLEVKQRLQEVSAIVNSASLLADAPIPETKPMHAVMSYDPYGRGFGQARTNIFYDNSGVNSAAPVASFL